MSHSLSKKFTFGSLLLFALPTTVMMVVMSLYTIVDGVFVSRFVSTNALSSVNIVYPVINIVLGISVMLSMGSNAIVAKKMGEGRPDSARETFTAIILLNIIIGLAFAIIGNLTAVPLSRMLGASDLLLEDCVTYLRWLLLPPSCFRSNFRCILSRRGSQASDCSSPFWQALPTQRWIMC